MWKMQLLDEDHILIRYASEEVATIRIQEPNAQASFFMIYNINTAKVNLMIYFKISEKISKSLRYNL